MRIERPGLNRSSQSALVEVSTGFSRPRWFLSDDVQSLSPGVNRSRNSLRSHAWRPPTDVYETDEALVVRVEIAGMEEKDFTISLTDRLLTIRGVRQEASERRAYHQMEIFFGEFVSEIELPCAVQPENVNAEYQFGFLRLELPKEQPLRIHISDE